MGEKRIKYQMNETCNLAVNDTVILSAPLIECILCAHVILDAIEVEEYSPDLITEMKRMLKEPMDKYHIKIQMHDVVSVTGIASQVVHLAQQKEKKYEWG